MIQFEVHNFLRGWFNHHLDLSQESEDLLTLEVPIFGGIAVAYDGVLERANLTLPGAPCGGDRTGLGNEELYLELGKYIPIGSMGRTVCLANFSWLFTVN